MSVTKNCFQCFAGSCGAKGNVLDFVAALEQCSVRDAALKLQDWFSLATDKSVQRSTPTDSELARKRRVVEQTATAEKGMATESNKPLGFELRGIDHGHEYLTGRGIERETAEHFGVGLFPGKGSMSGRLVIPILDGTATVQLTPPPAQILDESIALQHCLYRHSSLDRLKVYPSCCHYLSTLLCRLG